MNKMIVFDSNVNHFHISAPKYNLPLGLKDFNSQIIKAMFQGRNRFFSFTFDISYWEITRCAQEQEKNKKIMWGDIILVLLGMLWRKKAFVHFQILSRRKNICFFSLSGMMLIPCH